MKRKINNNKTMYSRGVGYIRISDKKQIDGESPETQKKVIKEYARRENIEITEWFFDEARSGKNAERKELQSLLDYVIKRANKIDYIVAFKVNRASRDAMSYYTGIKAVLAGKGIQIRSATEPFDDSPVGRFIEGVLVLNGQLDNEIKSSQVLENMKSLAMQGYWQHKPILGYEKHSIPNELGKMRPTMKPSAMGEEITRLLSRFSKGDLTKSQITQFANDIGLKTSTGKDLKQEAVTQILKRPEYAGYVHSKLTGNELVEGKHQALISKDIYWLNQEILGVKTKIGESHSTNNKDYPLKKTVLCHNCKKPLYGSAPRTGSGHYSPRYHCARKECRMHTGSISTKKVHKEYIRLLDRIQPSDELIKLFKSVIIRKLSLHNSSLNLRIQKKREDMNKLADTRLKTIEESIKTTDTKRKQQLDELLNHLDHQKAQQLEELQNIENEQTIQASQIEYITRFMHDIAKQWRDADYDLKIKLQMLVFPEGLTLNTKTGEFGTAKISTIYRCIPSKKDSFEPQKSCMVTLPGIEPGLPG